MSDRTRVLLVTATEMVGVPYSPIPLKMAVDMELATQAMTQALRQLFDENLLPPDVSTGIQYIPPEDTPRCSRGSSCRGSGRVDIVEFIRYDSPLEAVCDYVANYTCAGNHCKTKCLTYLRTGLCATCQRKPIISLEKPLVDSLGRACQISVRPRSGFVIPQTAYRSLIDFPQCDPSFCNHAIPTFLPLGWVSLAFHQPQRDESNRMPADGMCQILEPNAVAILAQTRQPCAEEQACEVEPPTEEGDDWRCQLDLSTARLHGGQFCCWDEDYMFLGARERRRRRHQAKKSIRNMRTRK